MFVIADYPDNRQQIFENHYHPINQKYAEKFGYEYKFLMKKDLPPVFRGNMTWYKLTLLKSWIEDGTLQKGDEVFHLDADAVINNLDEEFRTDKDFAISIDCGNSFCWGAFFIRITDWSIKFINDLLDENLWSRCRNEKHFQEFREQACFYRLCGIKPHSDISFLSLPNYGWMGREDLIGVERSLDDLYEHIEILGPEWNATLMADEQETPVERELVSRYLINPVERDKVRIRHFAGGQKWRTSPYCDKL